MEIKDNSESVLEDNKILEELLEQNKKINETALHDIQEEYKKYIEDVHNNLNIFATWVKNQLDLQKLYQIFANDFDEKYRSDLFENMYDFFLDDKFVTDNMIFYWKCLVINLLQNNKKYKSYISDLHIDFYNMETNFRLIKEKKKYIFKCFIEDEMICYFKENGNMYYVC